MNDREKLMQIIASEPKLLINLNTSIPNLFKLAENLITNDVVPIVRCKNCRSLYDGADDYCCTNHKGLVLITPDSFCSYGERRDDHDET